MIDQAPFCNVKLAEVKADPATPSGLQPIPPGASLDQAIRIINGNFSKIAPNKGEAGKTSPDPRRGGSGGSQQKQPGKKPKNANWVEASRVTETVRITNPQDDSQYVDVKQINKLVMRDVNTGATWEWDRGS